MQKISKFFAKINGYFFLNKKRIIFTIFLCFIDLNIVRNFLHSLGANIFLKLLNDAFSI